MESSQVTNANDMEVNTERLSRIAIQKRDYESRNREIRNKRKREEHAVNPGLRSKRYQATAENKRRYRENLIFGMTPNVENVIALDIGDLEEVCSHCDGLSFKNEIGRSKNSCCHGKKILTNCLNKYPDELRQLIFGTCAESRHFRDNIRSYNNAFAFASFNCTNADIYQRGPYCMRIVGDTNRKATTSLLCKGSPRYAQIYIFDDNETSKLRMNNTLRENVLSKLQTILRNNPYAEKYRQLYDVFSKTKENTVTLNFLTFKQDDMRRYNEPTEKSIAAIIATNDGAVPENVDVKVFPKKDVEYDFISTTSQHADPMLFPLLFSNGENGWSYLMKTENKKNISPLQYYSYRLTVRKNENSPIFFCGRLTQQYIINCYLTVESQRLKYLRFNQGSLRTECYQGIVDHISRSNVNTADITKLGNVYILPSTFQGSARQMQQLYQDAMAICRKIGRPDLFITMTCNPKWPEITRYLETLPPGLTANDIPHFTSRLFFQKVSNLIKELDIVFGAIKAYVYTIEFQKRGLPHIHLLVTLNQKLLNADDVDKFISAEIPDKDENPLLWYKVIKHMLHGPHHTGLPCYDSKTNACSKNFPKPYTNETDMTGSGFPKYRRRNNKGEKHTYHGKRNGQIVYVDNSMVVPYNPYLLAKYDCHINVEYCHSSMSIKYIHKYIHKGHDKAKIRVIDENTPEVCDEIQNFIDSRYLSAQESAWRLFELPMHGRSHAVERLPIHLPGMNRIIFQDGAEADAIVRQSQTKLTAFFDLNKIDDEAKNMKYEDIPLSYCWNNKTKLWKKRVRRISLVSRLVSVSTKAVELFHLKLLLRRRTGATCFDELKVVDNCTYTSFKEAAEAMGLVSSNTEIDDVLTEACSILMPHQLRHFFVYMLMGCACINGLDLWNKFKQQLSEDTSESDALNRIGTMLENENSSLEVFGITKPDFTSISSSNDSDNHQQMFQELYSSLNDEQKIIFDEITSAFEQQSAQTCFYIDGPGGVGKTFLYRCLMHYMNANCKKVFTIAWTGIAAILLPSGRTAHKSFQLPLNIEESTTLYWNTKTKQLIKDTDAFIWDEASMIPAAALESIDIALRDICSIDQPFGGKFFLLGGDFRQILPVVRRGGKSQIISATIKSCNLWKYFINHTLHINKRAGPTQMEFAQWLITIGNGDIDKLYVTDQHLCNDIVEEMYDGKTDFMNQAILTPRNEDVSLLNRKILGKIPFEEKICEGIDMVMSRGTDLSDEGAELQYPIDYINSLTPSGFPPQKLLLKKNAIVMLIRNLCVSDGLCNGTRLLVKGVKTNLLSCEILTGDKKGSLVYIPRVKLDSSADSELPFVLHRFQFPVRLAFAITINKSQGQSFDRVGLYLMDEHPIFSHGQLYVALSRCKKYDGIKIQLSKDNISKCINNIVYKEVLQ